MILSQVLAGAAAGAASAIVIDLDAYLKARSQDHHATYDWVLVIVRAVKGAITGAVAGAGLSAVGA